MAWFYGVTMDPSRTEYDSIEMPTNGMYWTSPPDGSVLFFFVCATTNDSVFAQNGFVYNGLNDPLKITQFGTTDIPPHSWGMFWTYSTPLVGYKGDGILPPPGWDHTDPIYFSIAVYPSTNCLSFMFTNAYHGPPIVIYRTVVVNELFTGNVGGLSESGERSGFGDIYVNSVAVWAQVPGEREVGPGYVYDGNYAPYSVLIYKYGANDVRVGFYGGSHYSAGYQLWSSSMGAGEENYPPPCPP